LCYFLRARGFDCTAPIVLHSSIQNWSWNTEYLIWVHDNHFKSSVFSVLFCNEFRRLTLASNKSFFNQASHKFGYRFCVQHSFSVLSNSFLWHFYTQGVAEILATSRDC
jgi:hypothetical protein